MRISCSEAGEPVGHHLHASYFLFSAPEGGEKTRREEQLIPRAGLSTDRDGTDDDQSEGGFHPPFPLGSGTTGVAQEPRSGKFDSTSSS
jgi:hypothetical protein